MAQHTYRLEATAAAPPASVFAVLVDVPGWVGWAPTVRRADYGRAGVPAPHGVGALRRLGAAVGPRSVEEVVAFEEPSLYAYEIRSAPLPVGAYRAEVRLAPAGRDGTTVVWSGRFDTRVPGVAWFLRRTVAGFLRGLVAEAERRASSA